MVRARVIAEASANVARFVYGVVSRDARVAASGDEKCGDDPEEGRLAGAIRAKDRQRFAFPNLERHAGECHGRRFFERLKEGAPSAAGRRKRLGQRVDLDGGFRHQKPYSVSAA